MPVRVLRLAELGTVRHACQEVTTAPASGDDELYEKVREQGGQQGEGGPHRKRRREHLPQGGRSQGRKSRAYEDWTVGDLRKRAGEIGIDGRSKMNKAKLVKALRNH